MRINCSNLTVQEIHCHKAIGLVFLVSMAVLIVFSACYASGTIPGHASYTVAMGCGVGSLVSGCVGAFFLFKDS